MIMEKEDSIMDELDARGFLFYLTGSQFFGNTKENSGLDFLTEYNDYITEFLEELGFQWQEHRAMRTLSVWTHPGDHDSPHGYMVLVSKELKVVLRARDYIKSNMLELYTRINKATHEDFWYLLTKVMKDVE